MTTWPPDLWRIGDGTGWGRLSCRPNGMPSFGGRLPEREIWHIIAFIESLGGMQKRADPHPQGPARSQPEREAHK